MSLQAIKNVQTPVEFGETVENFHLVQEYLVQFGFLKGDYRQNTLDRSTGKALSHFREFYLQEGQLFTGRPERDVAVFDDVVKAEMSIPRCGMPIGVRAKGFDNVRCPWGREVKVLRYLVRRTSRPRNLSQRDVVTAVDAAFESWREELRNVGRELRFEVTKNPLKADIAFQWRPIDIRLGNGAWGHADYPPQCPITRSHPKPIHLSVIGGRANEWTIGNAPGARDLQSAVLHEIGHILGLGDIGDRGAVMSNSLDFNTKRRDLGTNEEAGIFTLYA